MMTTTETRTTLGVAPSPQQVVVVSKQSQMTGFLETVLDAGQYDVVFGESTEHAYSHIKRLSPNRIIVCLDSADIDGFQVLSMLKLDVETKGIPVVTCTISGSEDDPQDDTVEPPDDVFSDPPALAMN